MKNARSICGKALLLSLCAVLLLLAGCSSTEEEPEESPFYNIELTDENSMEITVVNATGVPVEKFWTWWVGSQGDFDLLHNLGRNLEPDESITVRIPRCEDSVYSFLAEGPNLFFYGDSSIEIPEGGIVVLLPNERYDVEIQTIFDAGTDVETAKETALSQYQAACDAEEAEARRQEEERLEQERLEQEKKERLANLSQEEIDEALASLGYKSLADMRTMENFDISFRDYNDEYEMQQHGAFYELYGYWYPNGDRNSLTYIGITDQKLMWYQFDPEQGDVEVGSLRLLASSGGAYQCTFTLADDNTFTAVRTSLLKPLSTGTLTFGDCSKEYCVNAEYYYSKY